MAAIFAIGDRVRLTKQARDELDGSYPPRGVVIDIKCTRDGLVRFRLRLDPDQWGKAWELDFKYEELERDRKAA